MDYTHEKWDPDSILAAVCSILHNLITDYDPDFSGQIGPETWLSMDLMMDSLTLVAMMVEMEGRFRCKGLPFDEIFLSDGGSVEDLQVSQLVSFLHKHVGPRTNEMALPASPRQSVAP